MKTIITTIAALIITMSAFSQDTLSEKEDTMKTMPFQISFVPPMSTNGLDNHKMINRVSVNILAGFSGGTNGVEVGGFVNVNKQDMTGGQFGGFANIIGGDAKGVQAAGFFNTAIGSIEGAQLAGFHNYASDSLIGTQAAGFSNVTKGKAEGAQLAGFVNLATASSKGVQAAGFSNTVVGNLTGTQAAGFVNMATDSVLGSQIAGFVNYSKRTKGAQVAGFVNIAPQEIEGFQLAGFVNIAKRVEGMQLGFLNIADTVDGVPVGFLSFVLKGYHKVEIKGTETMHLNASFKTGVNRFYNIFSAGANFSDKVRWAYGYGVGTYVPFSEKTGINVDLSAYHINEEEAWTDDLNLLNRLDVNFTYKLANHFEIAAGPALNVLVSEYFDVDKGAIGSNIAPYSFYNHTTATGTNVKMWVGGSLAMRF